MKTAGEILQEARLEKKETIQEISKRIHIREDYLEALEKNESEAIPKGPFAKGFLSAYAQELDLDPARLVAIYRRDFGKVNTTDIIPSGVVKPIQRKTQKTFLPHIFSAAAVVALVGSFVFFQFRAIRQPPKLVVLEPVEQQQTRNPAIVRGKTATDAVVLVNTQTVSLNQDGEFYLELPLSLGEHAIVVEAVNRQGKSSIVQRNIHVIE